MKQSLYCWGLIVATLASTVGCSAPADGTSEGVSQESAEAIALATYRFGSLAGTSKCLDVNAAGSADGTKSQSWACNGSAAQSFRVEAVGSNYRIVGTSSGKCVDVAAAGTADGTKIQLWSCNGTSAQTFRIEDLSGGKVRIVNVGSNKCLDVAAASSADG